MRTFVMEGILTDHARMNPQLGEHGGVAYYVTVNPLQSLQIVSPKEVSVNTNYHDKRDNDNDQGDGMGYNFVVHVGQAPNLELPKWLRGSRGAAGGIVDLGKETRKQRSFTVSDLLLLAIPDSSSRVTNAVAGSSCGLLYLHLKWCYTSSLMGCT